MNWKRCLPADQKRSPARYAYLVIMLCMINSVMMAGCNADMSVNGSFDIAPDVADDYLRGVRKERQPLERPIVILSGFLDPGFAATSIKSKLKRLFDDDRILSISFATSSDFHVARDRVIEKIDDTWPPDTDSEETIEVDVIAHSMGGLVARYAAMPLEGRRRLRVARVFTVATPHGGADAADLPTWHKMQKAMRTGSDFLEQLDAHWPKRDYELYPYVRLGDFVIGSENAAPPGEKPWWLDNQPLTLPHMGAYSDPRILGDIVRRLRGEEPYTTEPREPLPGSSAEDQTAEASPSDAPDAAS